MLIVGYESGDQQILKNIKKGATVERARDFTRNCKKLGLVVHGDFILGLRRRDLDPEARFVLHGAIAVMLAVLAEGFFEYNLGDSEVLTMFLNVMGFAYVALNAVGAPAPNRVAEAAKVAG